MSDTTNDDARRHGREDHVRPRRPNIIMVVLDDCGFAQLGCFGSEMQTPNVDALAEDGLRFNAYHVTALCSPTRACLLTGRNHHAVGMGLFPEVPGASPGYSGRLPDDVWTLPRALRDSGYSTFAVGKWHITPLGRAQCGGAVHPLAARAGVRALLRLPRRGGQPVVAVAGGRQPRHPVSGRTSATATTSARTSPARRSR